MTDSPCARVLVVDDDRAVGMVVSALLTQAGHQTRFVSSGPEALAALAGGGVDIVISDVRMPGMDGMELLAEVRHEHLDVPVVLRTAHGTVSLAVEAMKTGAADFLTKPFGRDEGLFPVGKALRGAQAKAARELQRLGATSSRAGGARARFRPPSTARAHRQPRRSRRSGRAPSAPRSARHAPEPRATARSRRACSG
jgi:DNA-binding NtrC family response regulator